jgi:hypothetical protein
VTLLRRIKRVSSARLYWENKLGFFAPKGVGIPVTVSAFPDEIYAAPRSWVEQAYRNLIHYTKLDRRLGTARAFLRRGPDGLPFTAINKAVRRRSFGWAARRGPTVHWVVTPAPSEAPAFR